MQRLSSFVMSRLRTFGLSSLLLGLSGASCGPCGKIFEQDPSVHSATTKTIATSSFIHEERRILKDAIAEVSHYSSTHNVPAGIILSRALEITRKIQGADYQPEKFEEADHLEVRSKTDKEMIDAFRLASFLLVVQGDTHSRFYSSSHPQNRTLVDSALAMMDSGPFLISNGRKDLDSKVEVPLQNISEPFHYSPKHNVMAVIADPPSLEDSLSLVGFSMMEAAARIAQDYTKKSGISEGEDNPVRVDADAVACIKAGEFLLAETSDGEVKKNISTLLLIPEHLLDSTKIGIIAAYYAENGDALQSGIWAGKLNRSLYDDNYTFKLYFSEYPPVMIEILDDFGVKAGAIGEISSKILEVQRGARDPSTVKKVIAKVDSLKKERDLLGRGLQLMKKEELKLQRALESEKRYIHLNLYLMLAEMVFQGRTEEIASPPKTIFLDPAFKETRDLFFRLGLYSDARYTLNGP